jgi:hypothetical protein
MGAQVIGFSYKKSRSEIYALLDQCNGLYIHGDSHEADNYDAFQVTFSRLVTYIFDRSHNMHKHFPVLMMGRSLIYWLNNRIPDGKRPYEQLTNQFTNVGVTLRLTMPSADSYIFDSLQDAEVTLAFSKAKFFNR